MEYVALAIAVFLGGLVSGFAGFAFSAAAGAILLHFLPPMQAIPLMMMCSIASQMTSIAMLRKSVAWNEIAPLLIGGALGVPIALHLLTLMQPHLFRIGFGIFLASYALYMLMKPAVAAARLAGGAMTGSVVGFAGGLVGGLTAMPGALPVIWCELRGVPKEHQRGVVQPFILGMQVFALALMLMNPGVIDRTLLVSLGLALPALAAGTLLGVTLFGRVDDRRFRIVVLGLLLVSGVLMIR
jgi:uncharacterized protein